MARLLTSGRPRVGGPRTWDRARSALGTPLAQLAALYLAVRGLLLVADVLAAHLSYDGHLAGPLASWDSHFYLDIAEHGYPATAPRAGGQLTYSSAGFPPVFPLCIAAVAALGVPFVGAAIIASVLLGWGATVAVWAIGRRVGGDAVGYGAAALFAAFPGMAVSWGLLYSECAGTALVALALLFMMRRQWGLAGLAGAFATATSPVALCLVPAAALPAVQSVRRRQGPAPLLAVLMSPLGFIAFALWDAWRYHDLFFYWHLQRQAWGVSIDFGRGLITYLLPHLWRAGYQGTAWMEWIAVVAVLLAGAALYKARLPGYLTAYTVAVVVLLFCTNQGLKPRLLTWAFPAFIAVAATLKDRPLRTLTFGFMGLLPILFVAYTCLGNVMVQP